jgi:hypothetical protein
MPMAGAKCEYVNTEGRSFALLLADRGPYNVGVDGGRLGFTI